MRIKEVHIWSNGNVKSFTDDKSYLKECNGFIMNENLIKTLNKYCDKNTEFSFGVIGEEKMLSMDLRWWFKNENDKKL